MFYKVSYTQGFCSLLDLGTVLKKRSQYPADGAEYCDFTFLLYGGSRWLSIIINK